MAEGDYEYEKMRCELLGLPPPEMKPESAEGEGGEEKPEEGGDDGEDSAPASDGRLDPNQELEIDGEQMKHVSGGLDELNNILSVTQKKLNKFKVVCGSLTNLLKMKVGTSKGDDASSSNNDSQGATDNEEDTGIEVSGGEKKIKPRAPNSGQTRHQADMGEMLDSQTDKLDSLIMKAEKAELSMSRQNKQMRHFLRK